MLLQQLEQLVQAEEENTSFESNLISEDHVRSAIRNLIREQ